MDVAGHFKSEEIKQMDAFQGGADRAMYGAPYYGKLWEIIEGNAEVKEKIALAVQGMMNLPEDEAMQKRDIVAQENEKIYGSPEGEVPPPKYPVEQELASKGEDGDTEIAFMPEEMMGFLWDLYPEEIPVEERVNEETGLPEFGWLDWILPIVGGIIGTIILPGIGTAIGSGLGTVAGDTIHNISTDNPNEKRGFLEMAGRALTSGAMGYAGGNAFEGLMNGGLSGAANALGNTMMSTPYMLAQGAGAGALAYDTYSKNSEKAMSDKQKNEARINDYNDYLKETRADEKRRVDEKNAEDRKYREIENKRIEDHLKQVEANRLQDIANEKEYQLRREQQIKDYNSMYYPSISMNGIKALMDKKGVV